MSERIPIDTPEGRFEAYLARPAAPAASAVVVMHEVFGVNDDMRGTCDALATQGFLAICPDMFWRQRTGTDLDGASPAGRLMALALHAAFDVDKAVNDAAAAVAFARRFEGGSRKVGILGFGLGGLLSFRTGACMDVDAAVAYYGSGIQDHLDEARSAHTPLLLHLAGDDEFIPPPAQALIMQTLGQRPAVEIRLYPGCPHAFARLRGPHHDEAATRLAWQHTLRFLHRWLG